MSTINIVGTGGIIEGNLGAANVNVNLDSSLYFDGNVNDDRMVVTDDNTAATGDFGTGNFSVSAWFYIPEAGFTNSDSWGSILGKGYTTSAPSGGWNILRGATNNNIYWQNSTDAGGAFAASFGISPSGVEPYLGSWIHYCVTRNGTAMKLYVNGVLNNTATASETSNITNSGDFKIGTNNSNAQSANITVADVKLFDDELTAAEVQYLSSKVQADPDVGGLDNCESWWKINEGTGTNVVNHKKGSANGTITGAEWQYDKFSVDVYDNSTQTTGDFTVTQGKAEGLALTSAEFDNATDYINLGNHNEFNFGNGSSDSPFTFAGWIRVDDATSGAIFSVYNEYAFGLNASDKLYLDLYDNADNVYERQSSTNTLTNYENEWVHVAATYSGVGGTSANAGINLYVNGVAIAMTAGDSGTYTAMHNLNSDAYIGYLYGAAGDAFDGEIGEFRIYDQELSAEQIASLYSKTLAFTPSNLYRLDEGSGTTANDTGTATTRNGTLINDTTWNNGTLDLNRQLTIAANGTLSAPRGTLEVGQESSSGTANLEIDFNGTFIHNNGLFQLVGYEQKIYFGGATFYNLESGKVDWNRKYVREAFSVANALTVTKGFFSFDANINNYTATFSAGATINVTDISSAGIDFISNTSNAVTVQGDTVSPVAITGKTWDFDLGGSGSTVKLSNIDYDPDVVTGGNGVTIQLTGDCEFDAVTVSSGDTLDCGTHDITTSGTLTVEGTFTGGSGLHNINSINGNNSTGDITLTSGITFLNGGGSAAFSLASGLSNLSFAQGTLVFNQSDGNQRFEFNKAPSSNAKRMGRVVFNNGPNNAAFIGAVAWTTSTRVPTGDIIVASTDTSGDGFLTQNLNMSTDGNMTIATGGKLSAGSSELTVAGDFTSSGGLIGKSAMVVSGDNDYEGMVVTQLQAQSDWNFSGSEGLTIEGWFKFDDLDFGSGNDALLAGHVRSGDTTGKRYGCGLQIMDDKVMAIASNNDTAHTMFDNCSFPVTDMTAGKWHHLAMTVDANDSATPVVKLYLDGKLKRQATGVTTVYFGYNWVVGGYADNHDSQNWTGRRMDGCIARCSAFRQEMTAAQIRSMMFTDYTEMAALSSGVDEAKAVGWWQFDEGTGTAVDNKGTAGAPPDGDHSNFDGVMAAVGTTWAGGGTFTRGNSTVNMTGASGNLYLGSAGYQFNNLGVAPAGGTTTLTKVGGHSNIRVYGTLTDNSGTFAQSGNMSIEILGTGTVSDGATLPYICYWGSSTDVPISNYQYFIANTTTTLAGDLVCSGYFRPAGYVVNFAGNKVTAHEVIFGSGGGVNMGAGTLVLSNAAGLSTSVSDSVFTAGPGATVTGVAGKSTFKSQNNYEIVGNITNLDVTNEELTVAGTVTNCTGDIIQWQHSHDYDQKLDADTADDRDIKLGGPALDNANALNT